MSRGIPLYPAILAVAFVLSITLPTAASPYAGLRLILGFAVGALLLGGGAGLLLGDRDRAGVAAALLVVFVFKGIDPWVAIALLIGLGMVVVDRLAAGRDPSPVPWWLVGRIVNAGAVVFLAAVVLRAGGDGSLGPYLAAIGSEGPTLLREPIEATTPAADSPDVFVLILDGHARADKLAAIFGYDAGPFQVALTSRGFEVAPASRSNYLLTAQSLPSFLNMAPVADLIDLEAAAASPLDYTLAIRPLASNPLVFDEFRKLGYEVVAIASGFEEVPLRGADRLIDTGQLNELETRTLGNTVVAPAIQLIAPDWFAEQHRGRVRSVLQAAAQVAREKADRPRFVVVHVPSPHAPIVFAADGSPVPMTDLPNFFDDTFTHRASSREDALAAYAGQVAYVDLIAMGALDEILASAAAPPIVLVLSDHGSAAGVSWDDLASSDLDERTANLFAAYTPGRTGVFPPDITLVNVFGRLLEAHFGRAYEAQPNTAYRWGDSLAEEIPITLPGTAVP